MRIALLGTRGIPATYGGYETLYEELATRLVDRGHAVTVYGRSHYVPRGISEHHGARLVVLPTVRQKYLDTPVHTLLSSLHALSQKFDVALMVNSANSLFVPILRLRGFPVALNVDGIEKRRAKWGIAGRLIYAASERLAPLVASRVVTDAEVIQRYYLSRYGCESTMIPYGVDPKPLPPGETLRRLGLKPKQYFLYVSRFEPENNPQRVAESYRHVPGDLPLVMVGTAPYASSFIRGFTENADPRIQFPGAIYGDGYRELLSNARAFIQATEVGGTHPALVEAMGYGNCLIVNDTPENREVAQTTALYFRVTEPESLAEQLERVLSAPQLSDELGRAAAHRAHQTYTWESVCDAYERLFAGLTARIS